MSLCYLFDLVLHHIPASHHNTGFCICIVVLLINVLHKVVHGWVGYWQSSVKVMG